MTYPSLTVSRDKALCYGMPHIGARYTRDDVRAYEPVDDYVPCAACGRPASSIHHEPPRSASSCTDGKRKRPGSLLLRTEMGQFVLKPALIALCGTGTTGCHGKRHDGRLKIHWEFYEEADAEKWLSGWYLSRPDWSPHSERLYEIGRWIFEEGGKTWEFPKR